MPPVRFSGQRKTYARLRAFRSIVSSVQEGLMKVLSLLFAFALLAGAQETLTNDSIVKMVKGGLSDDVILTVIQKQPGKYSLTPDDLVKLKQQGVSEKILNAILNKGSGSTNAAPATTVSAPTAKPGSLSAAPNNTFFITWR